MRLIRKSARRLVRRPEFRGIDSEDLAQSLTLDLIERLRAFDPKRAKFTTFLFRVLKNRQADLIAEASAAKRRGRRPEPELHDRLTDASRRRRHRGFEPADPTAHVDLRHDVARALQSLSPHLRARCRLLAEHAPSTIARRLGIPLEAVQDDIARIRRHFLDHKLDAYV